MPKFTREEKKVLISSILHFKNWLLEHVQNPVKNALEIQPQELKDTFANLGKLNNQLVTTQTVVEPIYLSLLKKVIIYARREEAFKVEDRSKCTFNHNLRQSLEEELRLFSSIISGDWFKETEVFNCPKIIDFLSIKHAERYFNTNKNLHQRIYDEKFGILNAPTLFLPDLKHYRDSCGLRGVPLCVAYMDIDDFKEFNTAYGEPRVDRDVLPRFMTALETHIYSHGYAYRYGGDEYIILLPNIFSSPAAEFLKPFQKDLQELKYFDIEKRIAVSIGIFEVSENCIQTDHEVEERAASAKKFAKEKGKNCIATYKKESFADEDLQII